MYVKKSKTKDDTGTSTYKTKTKKRTGPKIPETQRQHSSALPPPKKKLTGGAVQAERADEVRPGHEQRGLRRQHSHPLLHGGLHPHSPARALDDGPIHDRDERAHHDARYGRRGDVAEKAGRQHAASTHAREHVRAGGVAPLAASGAGEEAMGGCRGGGCGDGGRGGRGAGAV